MTTASIRFPFSQSDKIRLSDALKAGKVLIFATETFYALGCCAFDEQAVHRIFQIKKRDVSKTLPLLINQGMADEVQAQLSATGQSLTREFWAGAMTLVIPAPPWIPSFLHAADGSVAVRQSDCKTVSALLDLAGQPLIGTSANFANEPPHVSPQSIPLSLKHQADFLIDSGQTAGEKPSTIVSVMQDPPVILREGQLCQKIQDFLKSAFETAQ